MKTALHPFARTPHLRGGTCSLAVLLLLTMTVLAPRPLQAQVTFDSFDDGDVSDISTFSETGGGIGVGPIEGADGTASALSIGVNPADIGGFAGFVIPGGAGTTDVSGTTYLSFYVNPNTMQAGNVPFTLEINLHEDTNGNGAYDGGTEDEYQAVYRLAPGSGFTFVQIPLASFSDDNAVFPGADDGFDFSNLLEIVVAFGGVQGPEFAFALDEIVFLDGPAPVAGPAVEFDFFNDGDVSDVGVFSETGAGIGVGIAEGADGTPNSALSVGINPAEVGSFAGFVIPGGEGTSDISDAVYLRFLLGAAAVNADNLPFTLEINLHEDVNGDGAYDGATEDEYQATYRLDPGIADLTEVLIPIASFGDDNAVFPGLNDGFDFTNLLEIVFAIGGIGGSEFAIGFDEMGFINTATNTAIEPGASDLPDAYVLSYAYPNPFNPQTRFDLTLERSQRVRVEVYDLLGRRVDVLHEGLLSAQTRHTFQIDARDWSSGIYLYRVTGETFSEARSVVLLK